MLLSNFTKTSAIMAKRFLSLSEMLEEVFRSRDDSGSESDIEGFGSDRSSSSSEDNDARRIDPAEESGWKTQNDVDTAPPRKIFVPKREPGPQVDLSPDYSPMDLFSLFIDKSSVSVLCSNTNKQAAKNIAKGKKYTWTPLQESELFKYMGLLFYFCTVRLPSIESYWRKDTVFSQYLPPRVMSRDRFRMISWNIHMSNPEEDVVNDQRKGTPQHDKLFRLKPLLVSLTTACKAHYHPKQNIAIDERMVARSSMKQYIKNKPTKWGFKLFVLADSDNGYTIDFKIYTGKSVIACVPDYASEGCSPHTSECAHQERSKRHCQVDQGTIHPAFSGDTVTRCVKTNPGGWGTRPIPCPTPIIHYNKHMGGVDLSDQLVQYYIAHRKSTHAYLLHLEIYASQCASYGRRTCDHCRLTRQKNVSTPWKCSKCDVALCVILERNCFHVYHQ
uniref:PiggyBac transposable element-derived protein domain-containing protein n=1 Tax=Neogobius melanostomus TaxID=47308 RepID=A0A8C6SX46_9GOBI